MAKSVLSGKQCVPSFTADMGTQSGCTVTATGEADSQSGKTIY